MAASSPQLLTVGDPPAAPETTGRGLAIETRDVHKRLGGRQILDGMSLALPEGRLCVVLGPSGTGKSVLIKHVVGLMKPDAGDVLVHGRSVVGMEHRDLLRLRRDVGVMFQDGALFSGMNVFDNVAFPLRQHTDLGEADVREIVMDQLAAVGLAGAGGRLPDELSGGMKKRVGLARALVLEPSVLVCDEPDSGLDPVRASLLGELLAARRAELDATIVWVTHDVRLARRIAEHVAVLWKGRVVANGPTEEVWASEHQFVRQFVEGSARGPLEME